MKQLRDVEQYRVERASAVRELFLLDGDAEEAGWQDRALCAQTDPEAFFPEKGGSTREAKKVCLTCEVRDECLESALDERRALRYLGWSLRERAPQAEEARRLSGGLARPGDGAHTQGLTPGPAGHRA